MADFNTAGFEEVPSLNKALQDLAKEIRDPKNTGVPAEDFPGLPELIEQWEKGMTEEEFLRALLRVFKKSAHNEPYVKELGKLQATHQDEIEKFINGAPIEEISNVGEEVYHMVDRVDASKTTKAPQTKEVPKNENDAREFISYSIAARPDHIAAITNSIHTDQIMKSSVPQKYIKARYVENQEFVNWGRTVAFTPAITFYPTNIAEVQSIVKYGIKKKQGVRVAGFRHSWSPIFGRKDKPSQKNNGDVLISMLPEYEVGRLPNFTALDILPSCLADPKTELSYIDFVDASYVNGKELDNGKRYVRVGTATTNEQFRRWCCDKGKVTLPANVIMVEITMGGANAPICHGAGIRHQTISDRVRCVEYVDAFGNLAKVDMSTPELMKTASGCFGLLGVVTRLTFECDPISVAVMRPVKLDVLSAIPPPLDMPDSRIPKALYFDRTPEQKKKDQEQFERRANEDYYAEWFWFPFSTKVWVNCWSTDNNTKDVVDYPGKVKATKEVLGTIVANIAQNVFRPLAQVLPVQQTAFQSKIAMGSLPDRGPNKEPIRTLLPNALHFQRGIQNIRVRDLEVEFPIFLNKETKQRDYTNVQRAWWDAIISCYEEEKTCPQRMPLEMRIMGDSEVTLAPQRGYTNGTCSIEILTLNSVKDIWEPYASKVLNKWMSLKDADGKPLSVRPHWAKEWQNYKVNGKPWAEVLKTEVYPEAIKEFKQNLATIAEAQGFALGDLKRMFSNEMFDYLFFDDIEATEWVDEDEWIRAWAESGGNMKSNVEVTTTEMPDLIQG